MYISKEVKYTCGLVFNGPLERELRWHESAHSLPQDDLGAPCAGRQHAHARRHEDRLSALWQLRREDETQTGEHAESKGSSEEAPLRCWEPRGSRDCLSPTAGVKYKCLTGCITCLAKRIFHCHAFKWTSEDVSSLFPLTPLFVNSSKPSPYSHSSLLSKPQISKTHIQT